MGEIPEWAERVPNTDFFCLKGDLFTKRWYKKAGSIVYEREMQEIPEIKEVLKPGNTVIDVGAFIGDYTRLFLDLGCKVIAFEPYQDAFFCLLHNCPEALCYSMAVGDGRKLSCFHEDRTMTRENKGGRQVRESDNGIPSIKLDDLRLSYCSFVKIDGEGTEPFVLDGMKKTFRDCSPVLYIEVNLPALRDHGFSDQMDIIGRLPEGYKWRVASFPERVGTNLPWDIVAYREKE